VEVDRPADAKHPVAEEAIGVRVPVGVPDSFPGRRPKVIGHEAEDPALPGALRLRFGKLSGDRRHDEAKDGEPRQAADAT
jgi:hypothetical protein